MAAQLNTRRNLDPTPPVRTYVWPGANNDKWLEVVPAPERHFVGGVLELPSALRMVGLVKNLPLNMVATGDSLRPTLVRNRRDKSRWRRGDRKGSCFRRRRNASDGLKAYETVDSPPAASGKNGAAASPTNERRRKKPSKSKPKFTTASTTASEDAAVGGSDVSSTPALTPSPLSVTENISPALLAPPNPSSAVQDSSPAGPSPVLCCRQQIAEDGEMSESQLRRETARMNLDVLRRLASMLGEEQEKYSAERQMLTATRNMLLAETRKVMSERGKLEAERLKVDLERDLLQSQVLSRGRRLEEDSTAFPHVRK